MEPTVADKLKEIQELATVAQQKRSELETQLSKLSQERSMYLRLAEERKTQIQELTEGLKQLPRVQTIDLASMVVEALRLPGVKTLRDICNLTGLKNSAVSQCLQGLVRQGIVKRVLPDGRVRGADFMLVDKWGVTHKKRFPAFEIPLPIAPPLADVSRTTFGSDKFVPPKASKTDKKLIDPSIQPSKKAD